MAGPRARQGPECCEGRPQGASSVMRAIFMNAAQLHGLQSDALRMATLCEGCPQQPSGQLRASGLALGDL